MLQKPLMKSYNPCIVPPSFRDCLPGSSWWVISTFVAHKPECTITLEGLLEDVHLHLDITIVLSSVSRWSPYTATILATKNEKAKVEFVGNSEK